MIFLIDCVFKGLCRIISNPGGIKLGNTIYNISKQIFNFYVYNLLLVVVVPQINALLFSLYLFSSSLISLTTS